MSVALKTVKKAPKKNASVVIPPSPDGSPKQRSSSKEGAGTKTGTSKPKIKRIPKTPEEQKDSALRSFLIAKLRSASRRWPPIYECKNKQKRFVEVEVRGTDVLIWHQGIFIEARLDTGKTKQGMRVMYECEICHKLFFDKVWVKCKNGKWKKTSGVALDHVEPVVPVDQVSWDWNTYIEHMFTGRMQLLCVECHKIKSAQETELRMEFRRRTK